MCYVQLTRIFTFSGIFSALIIWFGASIIQSILLAIPLILVIEAIIKINKNINALGREKKETQESNWRNDPQFYATSRLADALESRLTKTNDQLKRIDLFRN